MALVHKESSYCTESYPDLFTIPPTQLSVEQCITVEYQGITPLAWRGPLELVIDGNDDYTDLSQTYLYIKPQIVNSDGTELQDTDIVAPANLFLHSLFSKTEVKLNGRQVCHIEQHLKLCRTMVKKLKLCICRVNCILKILLELWKI